VLREVPYLPRAQMNRRLRGEGLLYYIAGCCSIPGEAIIGVVTRSSQNFNSPARVSERGECGGRSLGASQLELNSHMESSPDLPGEYSN